MYYCTHLRNILQQFISLMRYLKQKTKLQKNIQGKGYYDQMAHTKTRRPRSSPPITGTQNKCFLLKTVLTGNMCVFVPVVGGDEYVTKHLT